MPRIDYYDDPAAPPPNSLVVAASAVVADDAGRVLLVRRGDSGNWVLPGGGMELGESLVGCAVREVREETGLDVEVTGLVGIFSDPKHVIAYADGEVRQQFAVCFTARAVGGRLAVSDESTDVAFVDAAQLDALPMHPTQRLRIDHYAAGSGTPYLG
ncbi:NUDIX domain-containing protein [Yinghuangia aomiensis]|uniref:NUDIX domain-containing protein n=1 Tax=Yinghuangia aomiensis TaxID=676205 RepID=A0ABP9H8Q9_9ACTN